MRSIRLGVDISQKSTPSQTYLYRVRRNTASDRQMTRTDASDPIYPNTNPRSRHNVLVGPMRWFALTQRSDASDAVFRHTGLYI